MMKRRHISIVVSLLASVTAMAETNSVMGTWHIAAWDSRGKPFLSEFTLGSNNTFTSKFHEPRHILGWVPAPPGTYTMSNDTLCLIWPKTAKVAELHWLPADEAFTWQAEVVTGSATNAITKAVTYRYRKEQKKTPNQASDATSEPAPGAGSSSHQR